MPAVQKRLVGAALAALVASGLALLPSAPAQAAGPGLVLNEVYGGGGNSGSAYRHDFIELKNTSTSPIGLGGKSIQYRAATTTSDPSSANTFALPDVIVPAGKTYLIQGAAGGTDTGTLPTPDTTIGLNLSGTGGQVLLSNQTTPITGLGSGAISNAAVIDFVGWGSTTSSYEGTAPAPATTNGTASARDASGTDTDRNHLDLASGAPTPVGCGAECAPPLNASNPGERSGVVGEPITPITLTATGGTSPYSWSAQGLPAGLTLSGNTISGSPEAAGTSTVTVTVTDSATPTPATNSKSFDITVTANIVLTPIAEIQGTGARSPFAPASGNGTGTEVLTTEGVVTARYATGGFNGMYIQSPGADTPNASDGIFVYAGGSNANIPAGVEVGDLVRVTGPIAEFYDLTQIVPASASAVVELSSPGQVTPRAVAYPETDAEREVREGELLAPTDEFTVTNNYSTNQYAEIGLARGSTPLKQWTEYASPHDTAAINALKAENAARAVVLDDGQTTNFLQNQTTKAIALPWLTRNNPVRVGAAVTFTGPVVLDWRNNVWKFQPTHPVTDSGADVATFEDTRAENLEPADVGGDLTIATFNVLNYFNTTGEAYVAAGPLQNPPVDTHCTYYTDRQSNRIGNNQCGTRGPGIASPNDGRGPRGAATAASLARQEAKLAHTINTLDADIVGLEEVENSIKLVGETNRDDALARIVEIANEDAGENRWAYVKSPGKALTSSAIAEQDVIRGAFMYQRDAVEPVGQSDMLFGTTQFANAREPLAQAFKAKGASDADAFGVIVNHFKSKGDNASPNPPASGDNANDPDTGVGAYNGDRIRQAQRLVEFADDFAADRDIEAIFLAGDFNSYTMEDPIKALEEGGYELVESNDPHDESYSYSGLSGSLDHVLGNEAAMEMVTGADIWEINANESPAFQYSRYNYNLTDFWQPELPFATSDHNPEIVGIDVPDVQPVDHREIQVIATNDFHGRLLPDAGNAAGAAPFATAVKELRTENPNTVFVAAGDLVGASTFESFIQDDEPTIEALNAMGLEVSAAGNHEFDRGYADLAGRIRNQADWEYIAANLDYDQTIPSGDQLAETWTKTIDGVKVGFVGAVTEDLPALVNPSGIAGITVTDIVDATNQAAAQLKLGGADLVVLLVHEGSPSTVCGSASFTDPATVWGNIVQNTSADVDAIVSGHTHLAYNCRYTVEDWVEEDRAVTKRPVVSAGQYGTNLNQLVFKYDDNTEELVAISQEVIATAGVGYAPDQQVQEIVDAAVEFAATAGAEVLGQMDGPFRRAQYQPASGATENRGGESTLGNQVAEVQRWATDADLAFMNPGGLRADMVGTANGELRDLTYRQAADVQPFANTLVNMRLTGEQIKTVLEQQWQRNAQGGVPSRPFLRLGVSEGFTYTYVETPETVTAPNSAPVDTFRGEVTGMWLDGEPIDLEETYGVTVNSFLATGGDNFWELAEGRNTVDTGKVDLEAMVDYMDEFDQADPLEVDYAQRAVEVTFPGNAPEVYSSGDTVAFDVASWRMSAPGDVTDEEIVVMLGETELGRAPVDNTIGTLPYDSYGTASVEVTVPQDVSGDELTLMLVGEDTGTEIPVTVALDDGVATVQVLATNDFHGRIVRSPSSAEAGAAVLAGAVEELRGEYANTVFAAAGDLIGASTFESFIQNDKPTIDALNEAGLEVSAVGNHELDKGYEDLVDRVMAEYDAQDNPEGGAAWEYIAANLDEPGDADEIAPSWVQTFGSGEDAIEIGFVGAVTEHLPELVSPAGIAGLEVTDIVTAVNEEATALKDDGADIVVLLVHEGAPSTNCATMASDPTSDCGSIVTGVNPDVDAIVSGHTHLAYNCELPVAEWSDRAVTERPVVSAGQYGYNLNQLLFSFDTDTSELVGIEQDLLPLQRCTTCSGSQVWVPNYTADSAVQGIVDDAVAEANVLGAAVLGQIDGPFNRSKLSNGNENRGGESTLGNLVAEVQRWATRAEESGSAQIAFMNPGGLRADMAGTVNGAARDLTYRQAANVQPFANTLVNMDLTGADIKLALEQQWQPNGASRPFLRLGASKGFTYTYDASRPAGDRITRMWLDGERIAMGETYSVTVNSFLASGGDNFGAFNNGTGKRDTGKVDLEAMVDYMARFSPVEVDASQRAVGVTFPSGAPASYRAGDTVRFSLSSLAMAGTGNPQDDEVEVLIGDAVVDTAPVDNTNGTEVFDDYGRAEVEFVLPSGVQPGTVELLVRGTRTGTRTLVPITVVETTPGPTTTPTTTTATVGPMTWGTNGTVTVTVSPASASGAVTISEGATQVATGTVTNGTGTVTIDGKALEPGAHTLTVRYAGNATHAPSQGTVTVQVAKAATTLAASTSTVDHGSAATVSVTATPDTAAGAVTVSEGGATLGEGTLVDGAGAVTIPAGLAPGTHTLTVRYAGDQHHAAATTTVTLEVRKAASRTSATVSPEQVEVVRGEASIAVSVTAAGLDPTGTVVAVVNGAEVDSATLSGGSATLTVGPFGGAGTKTVTIRYSGDDQVAASSTSATVEVVKAEPRVVVDHRPGKVKAGKTRAKLTVKVRAPGFTPGGEVTVRIPGQANQQGRLDGNGKVTFRLDAFNRPGRKTVTVVYDGNGRTEGASVEHVIKVTGGRQ